MQLHVRGTRRRQFLVASVLAVALSLAATGCGPGVECDVCSRDGDCEKGLTCREFENGHKFCADDGTRSCKVPYARQPEPTADR